MASRGLPRWTKSEKRLSIKAILIMIERNCTAGEKINILEIPNGTLCFFIALVVAKYVLQSLIIRSGIH